MEIRTRKKRISKWHDLIEKRPQSEYRVQLTVIRGLHIIASHAISKAAFDYRFLTAV